MEEEDNIPQFSGFGFEGDATLYGTKEPEVYGPQANPNQTDTTGRPTTTDAQGVVRNAAGEVLDSDGEVSVLPDGWQFLEDIPILGGIVDFGGDVVREVQRGYYTGRQIDETAALATGVYDDEDVADYVEAVERAEALPPSREMSDFNQIVEEEGGSVYGVLKGLFFNPTIAPQIMASSLVSMLNLPGIGAAAATGGGTAATGVGAVVAPAVALGTLSAVTDGMITFNEFMKEELASRGLDFNKENVDKILNNADAMSSIRTRSAARGVAIGLIDGLTLGVSKTIGSTVRGVTGSVRTATAAVAVAEGVGGATGEAVGQVVSGQETNVADIILEGIAEVGGPGTIINTAGLAAETVGVIDPKGIENTVQTPQGGKVTIPRPAQSTVNEVKSSGIISENQDVEAAIPQIQRIAVERVNAGLQAEGINPSEATIEQIEATIPRIKTEIVSELQAQGIINEDVDVESQEITDLIQRVAVETVSAIKPEGVQQFGSADGVEGLAQNIVEIPRISVDTVSELQAGGIIPTDAPVEAIVPIINRIQSNIVNLVTKNGIIKEDVTIQSIQVQIPRIAQQVVSQLQEAGVITQDVKPEAAIPVIERMLVDTVGEVKASGLEVLETPAIETFIPEIPRIIQESVGTITSSGVITEDSPIQAAVPIIERIITEEVNNLTPEGVQHIEVPIETVSVEIPRIIQEVASTIDPVGLNTTPEIVEAVIPVIQRIAVESVGQIDPAGVSVAPVDITVEAINIPRIQQEVVSELEAQGIIIPGIDIEATNEVIERIATETVNEISTVGLQQAEVDGPSVSDIKIPQVPRIMEAIVNEIEAEGIVTTPQEIEAAIPVIHRVVQETVNAITPEGAVDLSPRAAANIGRMNAEALIRQPGDPVFQIGPNQEDISKDDLIRFVNNQPAQVLAETPIAVQGDPVFYEYVNDKIERAKIDVNIPEKFTGKKRSRLIDLEMQLSAFKDNPSTSVAPIKAELSKRIKNLVTGLPENEGIENSAIEDTTQTPSEAVKAELESSQTTLYDRAEQTVAESEKALVELGNKYHAGEITKDQFMKQQNELLRTQRSARTVIEDKVGRRKPRPKPLSSEQRVLKPTSSYQADKTQGETFEEAFQEQVGFTQGKPVDLDVAKQALNSLADEEGTIPVFKVVQRGSEVDPFTSKTFANKYKGKGWVLNPSPKKNQIVIAARLKLDGDQTVAVNYTGGVQISGVKRASVQPEPAFYFVDEKGNITQATYDIGDFTVTPDAAALLKILAGPTSDFHINEERFGKGKRFSGTLKSLVQRNLNNIKRWEIGKLNKQVNKLFKLRNEELKNLRRPDSNVTREYANWLAYQKMPEGSAPLAVLRKGFEENFPDKYFYQINDEAFLQYADNAVVTVQGNSMQEFYTYETWEQHYGVEVLGDPIPFYEGKREFFAPEFAAKKLRISEEEYAEKFGDKIMTKDELNDAVFKTNPTIGVENRSLNAYIQDWKDITNNPEMVVLYPQFADEVYQALSRNPRFQQKYSKEANLSRKDARAWIQEVFGSEGARANNRRLELEKFWTEEFGLTRALTWNNTYVSSMLEIANEVWDDMGISMVKEDPKSTGTVYGSYSFPVDLADGFIVPHLSFNDSKSKPDTISHEFTHAWHQVTMYDRPALASKAAQIIAGSYGPQMLENSKAQGLYNQITEIGDIDEAMAMVMGREITRLLFNNSAKPAENKTNVATQKAKIAKLAKEVKNWKVDDIKTVEDLAKVIAVEVYTGETVIFGEYVMTSGETVPLGFDFSETNRSDAGQYAYGKLIKRSVRQRSASVMGYADEEGPQWIDPTQDTPQNRARVSAALDGLDWDDIGDTIIETEQGIIEGLIFPWNFFDADKGVSDDFFDFLRTEGYIRIDDDVEITAPEIFANRHFFDEYNLDRFGVPTEFFEDPTPQVEFTSAEERLLALQEMREEMEETKARLLEKENYELLEQLHPLMEDNLTQMLELSAEIDAAEEAGPYGELSDSPEAIKEIRETIQKITKEVQEEEFSYLEPGDVADHDEWIDAIYEKAKYYGVDWIGARVDLELEMLNDPSDYNIKGYIKEFNDLLKDAYETGAEYDVDLDRFEDMDSFITHIQDSVLWDTWHGQTGSQAVTNAYQDGFREAYRKADKERPGQSLTDYVQDSLEKDEVLDYYVDQNYGSAADLYNDIVGAEKPLWKVIEEESQFVNPFEKPTSTEARKVRDWANISGHKFGIDIQRDWRIADQAYEDAKPADLKISEAKYKEFQDTHSKLQSEFGNFSDEAIEYVREVMTPYYNEHIKPFDYKRAPSLEDVVKQNWEDYAIVYNRGIGVFSQPNIDGQKLNQEAPLELSYKERFESFQNEEIAEDFKSEVEAEYGQMAELKASIGEKDYWGLHLGTVEKEFDNLVEEIGPAQTKRLLLAIWTRDMWQGFEKEKIMKMINSLNYVEMEKTPVDQMFDDTVKQMADADGNIVISRVLMVDEEFDTVDFSDIGSSWSVDPNFQDYWIKAQGNAGAIGYTPYVFYTTVNLNDPHVIPVGQYEGTTQSEIVITDPSVLKDFDWEVRDPKATWRITSENSTRPVTLDQVVDEDLIARTIAKHKAKKDKKAAKLEDKRSPEERLAGQEKAKEIVLGAIKGMNEKYHKANTKRKQAITKLPEAQVLESIAKAFQGINDFDMLTAALERIGRFAVPGLQVAEEDIAAELKELGDDANGIEFTDEQLQKRDEQIRTNITVGWQVFEALEHAGLITIDVGWKTSDPFLVSVKEPQVIADLVTSTGFEIADKGPWTKVSLTKPEGFTGFVHSTGLPLISHADKTARQQPQPVLDVVNTASSIPYEVHTDALEVYKQLSTAGLLAIEDSGVDLAELTPKAKKEYLAKLASKAAEYEFIINEASKVGNAEFFQLHRYDFRGRLYSTPSYFNHQGSKLALSLFRFKNKTPIGEGGWKWMLIQATDMEGERYAPDGTELTLLDQRFKHAESQLDKWMDVANDPMSPENLAFWQGVDEPFLFLATIMEIRNAIATGNPLSYESGLPIHMDATNSGGQVLVAMMKDNKGARAANVISDKIRGDLYNAVGEAVLEDLPEFTADQKEMFAKTTKDLKALWNEVDQAVTKSANTAALEKFNEYRAENKEAVEQTIKLYWSDPKKAANIRKIVKGPVMTKYYSAGVDTMSMGILSKFKEKYTDIIPLYTDYLAFNLNLKADKLMPGPAELMKKFQLAAKRLAKEGKPVTMIAPITGFKMVQNPRLQTKGTVKVKYTGDNPKIKNRNATGVLAPKYRIGNIGLDESKAVSSVAPNIVHMYDSQIVAWLLLNAGYDVQTIHDSFGSTPGNAEQLYDDIRTAFVEIFEGDILSEMFNQLMPEEDAQKLIKKLKNKGDLDISGIKGNEFAFSAGKGFGTPVELTTEQRHVEEQSFKQRADEFARQDMEQRIMDATKPCSI